MKYTPQVLVNGKWETLKTGFCDGYTHYDTCREIIEAHKMTGTPCETVWTDAPKPKRRGFRALLAWTRT